MRFPDETNPKGGHASRIRTVVINPNHAELSSMRAAIEATHLAEIVAETTSYAMAVPLAERHDPDFVFVCTGDDVGVAGDLISSIRTKCVSPRIVAVGGNANADDILRCFRSGADEFLVKPLHDEQLLVVFERLQDRRPAPSAEKEPMGQILAFWGSRGGCGTTTIACNVACMLAMSEPTVLVDFHFDQGDLAVYLDLQPTLSLTDANENADRMDEVLIESITTKHPSGLQLLLQPYDQEPSRLTDDAIGRMLQILAKRYAYVILDIGHDDSLASTIANYTNAFYLITKQNVPSLYLAARKLRLLDSCGYERDWVFIVVNEFAKRGAVTLDRVAKALGKSKIVCVRQDEDSVQSAMNQGVPLREISRRGKATKDIAELAQMIQSKAAFAEAAGEKKKLMSSPEAEKTILQEQMGLSTIGN
jgi:pilus assembly protein CpaE